MIDVKEKPRLVESALLIGVQYPQNSDEHTHSLLLELEELVKTLGIGVAESIAVRIKAPKPRLLLGTGKTESIIQRAKALGCDCIVFDEPLSPGQQRNWEQESGLCVIDRQEVILDIFAERAQTREARLQVELARMEYNLPRLKRAWTHLSRQRGGGVTQRGEGEAQIELDQRMVRTRIARLKRDLAAVTRHRAVQRSRRMRVPVPSAAIVGYTNAGKSSLLNALTQSDVLSADKLFATLDPTTRRTVLPSGQTLLLTDTVGFVRRLPHDLVESFKATLEEAVVADFLIHVLDVASGEVDEQRETTLEVLEELGADEKRIITVYNKIDCLNAAERETLSRKENGNACAVSAVTGEGIEDLLRMLDGALQEDITTVELLIPHNRYDLVNRLHSLGCVRDREDQDEGVFLRGMFPRRLMGEVKPFIVANGKTIALAD